MTDTQTNSKPEIKQIKQKFKRMKITDGLSDAEVGIEGDEFAREGSSVTRSSSDSDKPKGSTSLSLNAIPTCEMSLNFSPTEKFNMGAISKTAVRREADLFFERPKPRKSLFCPQ